MLVGRLRRAPVESEVEARHGGHGTGRQPKLSRKAATLSKPLRILRKIRAHISESEDSSVSASEAGASRMSHRSHGSLYNI